MIYDLEIWLVHTNLVNFKGQGHRSKFTVTWGNIAIIGQCNLEWGHFAFIFQKSGSNRLLFLSRPTPTRLSKNSRKFILILFNDSNSADIYLTSCIFVLYIHPANWKEGVIFSERELLVQVRYMSSQIRLSVCLSVTLVHPTQAVELFGNFFSPYDTPGTPVFWCQNSLVGDAPFPQKFAFKVTHPL